MILQVFSVFDTAVGAYMQPFFVHSKGEALRSFVDIVNDSKSKIAAHPDDYCLFHLGEYDDKTASFELLSSPVSLGVAVEFVKVVS